MKDARLCRIYACRTVGRPLCCADCWMRESCLDRCLNWPSRCRCALRVVAPPDGGEKPINR